MTNLGNDIANEIERTTKDYFLRNGYKNLAKEVWDELYNPLCKKLLDNVWFHMTNYHKNS